MFKKLVRTEPKNQIELEELIERFSGKVNEYEGVHELKPNTYKIHNGVLGYVNESKALKTIPIHDIEIEWFGKNIPKALDGYNKYIDLFEDKGYKLDENIFVPINQYFRQRPLMQNPHE